jgi:hypothetical protein
MVKVIIQPFFTQIFASHIRGLSLKNCQRKSNGWSASETTTSMIFILFFEAFLILHYWLASQEDFSIIWQ